MRQRIVGPGIVAIVRGVEADVVTDVVRATADGGVEAIEITVDTPGAVEMIRQASADVEDAAIGTGTALDSETVRAVQLAGAEFVVTPTVIRRSSRRGTDTGRRSSRA